MAKEEIIRYQLQELQMRKGWSQPYFNTYGVSTHNTRREALDAMNERIQGMKGVPRRFNNWSHSYNPKECFKVVEIKRVIEIEEPKDIKKENKFVFITELPLENLKQLSFHVDRLIKHREFEEELKSLIERANDSGINANTLLESITT